MTLIEIEEAYRPKMRQAIQDKDYVRHAELQTEMAEEAAPFYRAMSREAHSWPELLAKLVPLGAVLLHGYFRDEQNHAMGIYILPPEKRMPRMTLHLSELSLRIGGAIRLGVLG